MKKKQETFLQTTQSEEETGDIPTTNTEWRRNRRHSYNQHRVKKKQEIFLQPTQSEEETGDIPATRNRRYSYNEQRVKKKLARFLQRTKSKEETGDIPTTKTESEEETGDTPTTNTEWRINRRHSYNQQRVKKKRETLLQLTIREKRIDARTIARKYLFTLNSYSCVTITQIYTSQELVLSAHRIYFLSLKIKSKWLGGFCKLLCAPRRRFQHIIHRELNHQSVPRFRFQSISWHWNYLTKDT